MISEANNKTTTKYLVYWDDHVGVGHFDAHPDLASARAAASDFAKHYPGSEFHVAAHMTTFRAETVVKEV